MAVTWEETGRRLDAAAKILNQTKPVSATGPFSVGVDLGTADVVLMVLDSSGQPVAVFLEWAEVVRDGVVVDYMGAVDIVRGHVEMAEKRLGVEITKASTSFPPGTDPRLSTNVLETAGLDVVSALDEPTCVANLLQLDKAAVVDIGGGTTGTAVVSKGKVIFSDDEPSGGKHITPVPGGPFWRCLSRKRKKRNSIRAGKICCPWPGRLWNAISDIVAKHIKGRKVERIYLTGGTCCLSGIEKIFEEELKIPVMLPTQPLLLTPLGIASIGLES